MGRRRLFPVPQFSECTRPFMYETFEEFESEDEAAEFCRAWIREKRYSAWSREQVLQRGREVMIPKDISADTMFDMFDVLEVEHG